MSKVKEFSDGTDVLIKQIFEEKDSNFCCNFYADYYVEDIIPTPPTTCKLLFIVESPHTDEIKPGNKYPLAGDSGRNLSNFIYTTILQEKLKEQLYCKQTLSKLSIYNLKHAKNNINASVTSNFIVQLANEIDISRLEDFGMSELITNDHEFLAFGKWLFDAISNNPGIGIMNICNIPMQSGKVYDKECDDVKKVIEGKLEPLRSSKIAENHKTDEAKIHKLLIENTRKKILHYKPSIVVLCGRTAEYFYNEAKEKQDAGTFPKGHFIYHPSRIFDNNNMSEIPNHILNLSKALEEYLKK